MLMATPSAEWEQFLCFQRAVDILSASDESDQSLLLMLAK